MADLYDISPPLTPDTAVFPGDMGLRRKVASRIEDGAPVTLSSLCATVHLGAHVDAPSHYTAGGAGIDQTPLEQLLGPCRLVHLPECERVIRPAALIDALEDCPDLPSRILIATGSFPDATRWTNEFCALASATMDWLAAEGVTTVGIDTPSIDPADSKDLPAHAAARRNGITILEGLVLGGIPAGDYELIALPLRLVGFDGSPVRAVLRRLAGR